MIFTRCQPESARELAPQQRFPFSEDRERVQHAFSRCWGDFDIRPGSIKRRWRCSRLRRAMQRVQRAFKRTLKIDRRQPCGPVRRVLPVWLRGLSSRPNRIATVSRQKLQPALPQVIVHLTAARARHKQPATLRHDWFGKLHQHLSHVLVLPVTVACKTATVAGWLHRA